ncbi:MAG: ImmA/IrrE family metallo-endopeptidase [Proteobacteria bacterium]|nr:ImmA/IrrE family metallo-endopeptidase [Pseudomonadota bacterium]
MLQIDRMEIDDAGGNPVKLALAVLGQISDLRAPVPVREIAEALDIYEIREETLVGLEGGLVTPDDKSEGAILVNADRPETRKRYTVGHELGHYLNPWHKPTSVEDFRCSPKDIGAEAFKAGDRARQMEVEANEFASELLMPARLFQASVNRRAGIDLDHILSLADEFFVSREAAARRYVAHAGEPVAVIFSKEGTIRYVKKHPRFPALNAWSKDALPVHSFSQRSLLPVGEVSDWDIIDGDVWLRDARGQRVCEQTLAQRNGFRMTLIALEEPSDDDDEQDDGDWAPPTFRR